MSAPQSGGSSSRLLLTQVLLLLALPPLLVSALLHRKSERQDRVLPADADLEISGTPGSDVLGSSQKGSVLGGGSADGPHPSRLRGAGSSATASTPGGVVGGGGALSEAEVLRARKGRMAAEFAKVPKSWGPNEAAEAYKNLYEPGLNLPSTQGLRVILDKENRIFFRPEPYELWKDPSAKAVGLAKLAHPTSFPSSIPRQMYGQNRNSLEYGKEFAAHILVSITRALGVVGKEKTKGSMPGPFGGKTEADPAAGQVLGSAPAATPLGAAAVTGPGGVEGQQQERLPPVDVTFALWDWCGHYYVPREAHPNLPPLLSWNSRPNCNVITTPTYDYSYFTQNFTSGSPWRADSYVAKDWVDRAPQLLWRGSLSSWDESRARAVRIGLLFPELLDIKVACKGCARTFGLNKVPAAGCNTYLMKVAAYGGPVGAEDCDHIAAPFMGEEEQLGFRYVLDMDGGASSFRLKNLLLSGSLVFRVVHDTPADRNAQFFFDDLKPFVHYIPVKFETMEEDLPAKVQWAKAHDAEARGIAESGRRFVLDFLTERDALRQLNQALQGMAARQRGWTPGENTSSAILQKMVGVPGVIAAPAVPEPGFRRFCCADLQSAALAPVGSTWTNPTGELFKALVGSCKDRHPAECGGGGSVAGAGQVTTTQVATPFPAVATPPPAGLLSSTTTIPPPPPQQAIAQFGTTIRGASGDGQTNFFATNLEYVPL